MVTIASIIHRVGYALPPGLTYLLVKILPSLLLLPALVCSVLKCYAAIFDVNAPAWVYVTATIAIHPLAIVLNRAYTTWVIRRDRISKGALKLPELELSSRVILREMSHTFFVDYPGETFWSWAQRYGNTFMLNTYGEKTIFTIEPEDIKTVLATQFPKFEKGPVLRSMGHDLLGTGVFNADGDVWKFHRSMTRPFFSKDRISDFDNFERHATASISLIKERLARGYPVDFQDVVARFTLDSASEFLFGKDVESLGAGLPYPESSGVANGVHFDNHPSNMFVNAFTLGQIATAKRSRFGQLWPVGEFFKNEVSPHRRVVDAFIEPLINEALSKLEAGSLEKDEDTGNLLLNLVTAAPSDNKRAITDELTNILVAGRDTTASLLTFAVYSLDRHPNVMRKLREEILNTVGQRTPTYDEFRSMKYLRAVLNETLRLYPAVPFDIRSSNVSTTFPRQGGEPYHVPAHTRILYSVFWMHRRQDLWGPTALKFDPDRFIDERTQYITSNPFIFLPFNAGPRICLGQQFAYNEASYFLVRLLQSFSSISVVDEVQLRPPPEYATSDVPGSTKPIDTIMFGVHLTMYTKGGLWVTMKEEVPQSESG